MMMLPKDWSHDGKHHDLGPYNGPFPITELIKALYLVTEFAVELRQMPSVTHDPKLASKLASPETP